MPEIEQATAAPGEKRRRTTGSRTIEIELAGDCTVAEVIYDPARDVTLVRFARR